MHRPLRIAVLADTLPPKGHTGVGMSHSHLIAALRLQGFAVQPFVFLELPKLWVNSVKALVRSVLWIVAFLRRPWQKPGLRLELATDLLGAFSGCALLGRVQAWQPDWIVVPDYGAVAAFWPITWRKKTVLISHSNPLRFLAQPVIGLRDPLDAHLAWSLEARVSAVAAAIVAPSKYMQQVFERDFPHQGSLTVIPNLLDENTIASIGAFHLPFQGVKYRIFLPSPDNLNKGRAVLVPLLQSIARQLAPQKVVFVISGAVSAKLLRQLQSLPNNSKVYAPGPLPNVSNVAIMKACDLCVSPTFIENFGMALLEAQFCGLPVVAFDVGGTGVWSPKAARVF